MTLPTRGKYQWDYRQYGTPAVDCDRDPHPHTPGPPSGVLPNNPLIATNNFTSNWGIRSKVLLDANGTELSRTDYRPGGLIFATPTQQCQVPQVWAGIANIVFRELGNARVSREENYFSIWASGQDSQNRGWSDDEYGLPIVYPETPVTIAGQAYGLSRKTYRCPKDNRGDPNDPDVPIGPVSGMRPLPNPLSALRAELRELQPFRSQLRPELLRAQPAGLRLGGDLRQGCESLYGHGAQ